MTNKIWLTWRQTSSRGMRRISGRENSSSSSQFIISRGNIRQHFPLRRRPCEGKLMMMIDHTYQLFRFFGWVKSLNIQWSSRLKAEYWDHIAFLELILTNSSRKAIPKKDLCRSHEWHRLLSLMTPQYSLITQFSTHQNGLGWKLVVANGDPLNCARYEPNPWWER